MGLLSDLKSGFKKEVDAVEHNPKLAGFKDKVASNPAFAKARSQLQQAATPPGDPKPMEVAAKNLNEIPLEHVINLRNQGLSNNQIIQNLQREGYTMEKINNAINQSDIKQGVVSTPFPMNNAQGLPPAGAPPGMPPPGGMPPPMGMPAPMGMQQQMATETSDERLQEIAEAIIDEKWAHISENINKVLEWKEQTETRIAKMEQEFKDLKDGFDRLHEGVLGKIGDYDKSMTNIGTEIKALEKVFQKILPGFMENVNELSRITNKMKTSSK